MPVACPACNKAEQTAAACPRCGCDLAQLHAVEAAAASRMRAAASALAAGHWRAALVHARRSWRLHHTPVSAAAAFLAASAAGDSARALRWHERAMESAR